MTEQDLVNLSTYNHDNFSKLLKFAQEMVADGRVPVTYSDEDADEQAEDDAVTV